MKNRETDLWDLLRHRWRTERRIKWRRGEIKVSEGGIWNDLKYVKASTRGMRYDTHWVTNETCHAGEGWQGWVKMMSESFRYKKNALQNFSVVFVDTTESFSCCVIFSIGQVIGICSTVYISSHLKAICYVAISLSLNCSACHRLPVIFVILQVK